MEAAARREFEQTALPLTDNLYGAAMRLTRDPAEAEDLVQDAMVRAFRFWDTFKQGTNIKAWLFTILRNTFINGYHRRGRKRRFQNDVSAQVRSLGPAVATGNSTSHPPGPEEAVNSQITRARIREALDSLPPDYRLAVTLADLEGLSYKEIAEVMDCPIGTVMSRIYRGRKILHKLLYDHAVEIGMVDEGDPPAGQRGSSRARKGSKPAREETTEKISTKDAVDLAAYRDRRRKA
ncbi:sigma-70 family RNA polymerase sigma factor [Enhygromyxa salina]|nr:sigma-70 family RNA polymerase sigma factor [Enhygromyxa salina]